MDEDLFAKNAQSISKTYRELLLLMKFPQTKPQVKSKNIKFHDLYYIVIRNRDEREIVDNQYGKDYINFDDIIPNRYSRQKMIMKY